ncbi:MAG: response regulator [Bacteroidota bacterium]
MRKKIRLVCNLLGRGEVKEGPYTLKMNKLAFQMKDQTPTVVFVDDDPIVLNQFKTMLSKDYHVLTTTDVFEAFSWMKEYNVSVLFSDLIMPAMNGVDFLHRMSLDFPNTQRILLTGNLTTDAMMLAINKAKVFRVLPKPLNASETLRVLQDACAMFNQSVEKEKELKRLSKQNEQFEFLLRQQLLS